MGSFFLIPEPAQQREAGKASEWGTAHAVWFALSASVLTLLALLFLFAPKAALYLEFPCLFDAFDSHSGELGGLTVGMLAAGSHLPALATATWFATAYGRPVARAVVMTLLAVGVAGCSAYRPSSLTPAPGATARIVLLSPRTVSLATTRGGPRRSYDHVLEARGTVVAVSGDTIALRLGELRTEIGAIPGLSGEVALLPAGAIDAVTVRHFQLGRTLGLGLGISAFAFTVLIVALIVTLTKAAA